MKSSFILYSDNYSIIKKLSESQKAQLLDAIFVYSIEEKIIELDPVVDAIFGFIKLSLDRDKIKYDSITLRNRENGKLGGRPRVIKKEPKKPTGLSGNPKNPDEPKKPDNDTDNVTDTDSDTKNKKLKIDTIQKFEKYKDQIIKRSKELYPDKDVNKAIEDFISKNKAKNYGYTNYIQAFQNWVREDNFNRYSKKRESQPNYIY